MGVIKNVGRVVRSVDSLVKEDVKPLISGDLKEITGKIDALLGEEIKGALVKVNKLLDNDIPSLIKCVKISIMIIVVSVAVVCVGACVKFFM